jgi:hypothetical protein
VRCASRRNVRKPKLCPSPRQPTMNSSPPSLVEPRTPRGSKFQSRLNSKRSSRPTPSRNRKRYDPQRRLEVAETRRHGACARCREKKVRVSSSKPSYSNILIQLVFPCSTQITSAWNSSDFVDGSATKFLEEPSRARIYQLYDRCKR